MTGASPSESSSMRMKLRLRHERLGEDEHLLLAARQRSRREVEPLLQLGEQLERVRAAGPASCVACIA